MPDWISATLAALPLYLLILFGVGLPWAYALLPADERREGPVLLALAILLGAALITTWLFLVGTLAAALDRPLLTSASVAIGALSLAGAGIVAALRVKPGLVPAPQPAMSDTPLLIGLVALAVMVAAVVTAYWPFTAYDALWVYGYEARLYALTGVIPHTIDYYPQFIPLLYTIAQTGAINDHAARAVVPILHVGAILASYVLGRLVDGRRTGLYLAALWALYPHVGEWSRAGDLEIPLALAFTMASAFFLRGWMRAEEEPDQRRYRRDAFIAGLAFGVALWIKPTAGALAIGVALVGAVWLGMHVRAARGLAVLRPRLEVIAIMALACAPLGGAWYVRNLILGHAAVDFPPPFWQTLAERGGDEFGFPLLALSLIVGSLWVRFASARRPALIVGLALCYAAVARSILVPGLTLEQARMTGIELLAIAAGVGVIGWAIAQWLRTPEAEPFRPLAARLGWAALLALPYFVVWFWAYSYHYRLSFAVVPLLLLPTAALLARAVDLGRLSAGARVVVLIGLAAAALPGILSPIPDKFAGNDYLFTDELPDDEARYRSGNAALMRVVEGLRIWQVEHPGQRLTVSAPGIVRLPFFFPLEDIRTEPHPTRLEQIDDAAYFIYGIPETAGGYADVPYLDNAVIGVLARDDLARRAWWMDDGTFSYDVYELNLGQRWVRPWINGEASDDVVFGGFARYLGYDLGGLELWQGRPLPATLFFEVLAPPPADYSIFVHLHAPDGRLVATWDDPVARGTLPYHTYYSTVMWQPAEIITETRTLRLPESVTELGQGYSLSIGFYSPATQERVGLTVNGQPAGDTLRIENRLALVPPPPE